MLNVSFGECIVVLVVALFVLGPERLPVIARLLGRWWARAQRLWGTIRQDIEQSINK
jgi:sec-independent protein translocase protein TatB